MTQASAAPLELAPRRMSPAPPLTPEAQGSVAASAGLFEATLRAKRDSTAPTDKPDAGGAAGKPGPGNAPGGAAPDAQGQADGAQEAHDGRARQSDDSEGREEANEAQGGAESGGQRRPTAAPVRTAARDKPITINTLNDLLLRTDPALFVASGIAPIAPPVKPMPPSRGDASGGGSVGDAVGAGVAGYGGPPGIREPTASSSAARRGIGTDGPAIDGTPSAPIHPTKASDPAAPVGGHAVGSADNAPKPGESTPPTPSSTARTSVQAAPPAGVAPVSGASQAQSGQHPGPRQGGANTAVGPVLAAFQSSLRTLSRSVNTPQGSSAKHVPGTPEPFVAQVWRGLAAALSQKESGAAREVTLRLQPRSLGQLKVHLTLQAPAEGQAGAGSLAARFEASTPEARDLLSGSLGSLRATLESRGLTVQNLAVHLTPSPALPAPDPSAPYNPAYQHPDESRTDTSADHQGRSSRHASDPSVRGVAIPRAEPFEGEPQRTDPRWPALLAPVGSNADLFCTLDTIA